MHPCDMLVAAGFTDVRVEEKAESREFIKDWMPGSGAEDFVVSANVTAGLYKLTHSLRAPGFNP